MNVKKRKGKTSTALHRTTLPPSKQMYGHGESKPLIIAIIAIAAVLALSLLLLFSDRFVGKAISFGEVPVNNAGFFLVDNTLTVGESAVFPVQVNLGSKKSSIVTFELTYDMNTLTPDCSNIYNALDSIFVGADFNLVVMKEHTCSNGQITFTYAALGAPDHVITNVQTVAEITFTALALGQTSLQFTPMMFKVYDLEEMEPTLIPLTLNDGVIEVTAEVAAEELPPEPEEPSEIPTEEVPAEEMPAEEIPAEEMPAEEEVPAEEMPTEEVPAEEMPAEEETPLAEEEMAETPVSGVKINLVNVDSGNNFATKITSTGDFTGTEITLWTILYGANDKVLSIKSEKIPAGLAMDAEYTATSNYPAANVEKKSVIVYDVEQSPTVFGELTKDY